jgi:hypothetical protein
MWVPILARFVSRYTDGPVSAWINRVPLLRGKGRAEGVVGGVGGDSQKGLGRKRRPSVERWERSLREEMSMRRDQTVSQMVEEVLMRQAMALVHRSGQPLEDARQAVSDTEAGRHLRDLANSKLPLIFCGSPFSSLLTNCSSTVSSIQSLSFTKPPLLSTFLSATEHPTLP